MFPVMPSAYDSVMLTQGPVMPHTVPLSVLSKYCINVSGDDELFDAILLMISKLFCTKNSVLNSKEHKKAEQNALQKH